MKKNSLLSIYDPVTRKSYPRFEFQAVQWLICGNLLVITDAWLLIILYMAVRSHTKLLIPILGEGGHKPKVLQEV